jgi:hypothetical protein
MGIQAVLLRAIPYEGQTPQVGEGCEVTIAGQALCRINEPLPLIGAPFSGIVEKIRHFKDDGVKTTIQYRVVEGTCEQTADLAIEFNPDLALRNIREYNEGQRRLEECVHRKMRVEGQYEFLKGGHRLYWFGGELPLLETQGKERLSRPLASILMLETTHFTSFGKPYTRGKYLVKDVFDPSDPRVHFESYKRLIVG